MTWTYKFGCISFWNNPLTNSWQRYPVYEGGHNLQAPTISVRPQSHLTQPPLTDMNLIPIRPTPQRNIGQASLARVFNPADSPSYAEHIRNIQNLGVQRPDLEKYLMMPYQVNPNISKKVIFYIFLWSMFYIVANNVCNVRLVLFTEGLGKKRWKKIVTDSLSFSFCKPKQY